MIVLAVANKNAHRNFFQGRILICGETIVDGAEPPIGFDKDCALFAYASIRNPLWPPLGILSQLVVSLAAKMHSLYCDYSAPMTVVGHSRHSPHPACPGLRF